MAENGRNQMWILICEYGIPEYRDSINLQVVEDQPSKAF